MLESGNVGDAPKRDKETDLSEEENVLVIDLFAGIGGLTAALKKAGAHWKHLGVVEKDLDCRRLLRRAHPGAEFFSQVETFGKKEIKTLLRKIQGATGIISGGSPCQGLSRRQASANTWPMSVQRCSMRPAAFSEWSMR